MGNCAGTQSHANIADFSHTGATMQGISLENLVVKRKGYEKSEKNQMHLTKEQVYEELSTRKLESGLHLELQFELQIDTSATTYRNQELELILNYSNHVTTQVHKI